MPHRAAGVVRDRPYGPIGAVLAVVAVMLGIAAPAQATKYVDRVIGTTASGTTGGLFNGPGEVAVNTTGNGGVAAGTFYVLDSLNARVQRFAANGTFQRAWGANVVTAPVNEVQTLTVTATGGTFTLTYDGVTTAAQAFNVTAANLQTALRNLATAGRANILLTVSGGSGSYTITFSGPGSATNVSQITVNTGSLTGTASTGTTTQGSGAFEICTTAASCRAGAATSAPNAADANKNGSLAIATAGHGGVAVDGDTGQVYVVDAHANRVSAYTADGAFLRSFGYDVVASGPGNAGTGYEICVQANSDVCKAGVVGVGTPPAGQLNAQVGGAPDIVVSPPDGNAATGQVYVTNGGPRRVEVYNLDGSSPSSIGSSANFAANFPKDLAIGGGVLYASSQTTGGTVVPQLVRYDLGAASFLTTLLVADLTSDVSTPTAATTGLDYDTSTNRLLLARNDVDYGVAELSTPAATPTLFERHLSTVAPQGAVAGPLPGELTEFINSNASGHQVLILNAGATAADVTLGGTSDVTSQAATLNATINSSGGLPTNYQLQTSPNGVVWTTQASGTVPANVTQAVSGTATGLQPSTVYRVRVIGNRTFGNPDVTSAETTFLTDGVAPTIVSTSADSVLSDSARLVAYVNPNSTQTSYRFEYGTSSGALVNRVPTPNGQLGAGPDAILAAAEISGLQPAKTYYYRVVAVSATQGTTAGPERTFTTRSGEMTPRVAELVSPADKGTAAYVGNITYEPWLWWISDDGTGVHYPIAFGLEDSTAPGSVKYLATRSANGWSSEQLTPAHTEPSQLGQGYEKPAAFEFVSDDLRCTVLASPLALTPDASTVLGENDGANLFRRAADGSYELLTPVVPSNVIDGSINVVIKQYNLGYDVAGASQDCDNVVFTTTLPYEYPGHNNGGIYQSVGGTLKDVAVLPDGTAPATTLPSEFSANSVRAVVGSGRVAGVGKYAVSRDASHVFFTARSNSTSDGDSTNPALFLRAGGSTVKVSTSKTSTPTRSADFQAAARDGSKVAFMANYGITATSSSGPSAATCAGATSSVDGYSVLAPVACGLYVYDVGSGALTDISATADAANTNGATVDGVVDASDDLSRIYFTARGRLVTGQGSSYAQNIANATTSLYLWDSGTLRFITTVRTSDLAGVGGEFNDDPTSKTTPGLLARSGLAQNTWQSRVTPDGAYLVFSSRANIVGYDSGGAIEAYRYSVASAETVCVSCRRDGEPSVADGRRTVLTSADEGSAGRGPRIVSNDGHRIFFKSMDALAPGGVDGNENIYVWDEGVTQLLATGPSRFDASEFVSQQNPRLYGSSTSGDDVFIATVAGLDPRDGDGVFDVYDLRVGGGIPAEPAAAPACDIGAGACQGAATALHSPAVETATGAGDDTPPGARPTLTVHALTKAQLAALARGRVARLGVTVSRAGRVTVRGVARRAGKRWTAIAATGRAAGAGRVNIALRLTAFSRRELQRTGRLSVALTARMPGVLEPGTATLRLKGAKSKRSRTRIGGPS
ncbi:MAG: hypothetical protein ACJ762_06225 [Solirubrobacteraceae bacterium]